MLTGAGFRGQVLSRTGDLRGAESELRGILDLVMQSGMQLWIVTAFYLFCDCILERPQLADVAGLTHTLELDPSFLETQGGSMLLELRGRLALEAGDRKAALPDLEAAAATLGALRMGPTYSPWRSAL